ncbi:class GN sortase [Isoalcanivorax indicus]|uniref:class GN sortase n=1 Tax=Isoalcanivorax indicus TaxID=2202653 RepID=UPI000DB92294|nr:class GN sortase [Isoalcanivorax indicus]
MRANRLLAIGLLICAALLLGQNGWLHAKAWLAGQLIEAAWARTLQGDDAVRPWPWADTWPVARLTLPGGRHHIVLHDASGQSLAFGPGLLPGSTPAGTPGTLAIAGHQDTVFRALENISMDDLLHIQRRSGDMLAYRVTRIDIVDSRTQMAVLSPASDTLMLVTCYPFGAPAGTPWRYVIHAQRDI